MEQRRHVTLYELRREVHLAVRAEPKLIDEIIREYMIAIKSNLAENKEVRIAEFGTFRPRAGYKRAGGMVGIHHQLTSEVKPSVILIPYVALRRLLKRNADLMAKQ